MKTIFQHFHEHKHLTSTVIEAARVDENGQMYFTVDGEEMTPSVANARGDGLTIRIKRYMTLNELTSVEQLVGKHFFRMDAPGTDQGWLIDVTAHLEGL